MPWGSFGAGDPEAPGKWLFGLGGGRGERALEGLRVGTALLFPGQALLWMMRVPVPWLPGDPSGRWQLSSHTHPVHDHCVSFCHLA